MFFGEDERGRVSAGAFFTEVAFPKEYEGLEVVTLLVAVFESSVDSLSQMIFEVGASTSLLSARLRQFPTVSTFVVGVL